VQESCLLPRPGKRDAPIGATYSSTLGKKGRRMGGDSVRGDLRKSAGTGINGPYITGTSVGTRDFPLFNFKRSESQLVRVKE